MPASEITKEIISKHNYLTSYNRFIGISLLAISINIIDSLSGPYKDYIAVYILVPTALLLLVSVLLYKSGHTLAARILAAATFNITLLLISLHIGQQGGTYLYYFPFILAFIYLFRSNTKPVYTWGFAVISTLFLIAAIVLAPAEPRHYQIPAYKLKNIFLLTFFLAFSMTVYFFILIFDFERKLYKRILELENRNRIRQLRSVIETQEKNNEQLMLELRDNINQTLAASRVYLEKSMEEPYNPEFISKSRELTSEAIQTLTLLCLTLYPGVIRDLGLQEGIREFLTELKTISPLEIAYTYTGNDPEELEAEDKLSVFRIIQEYISLLLKTKGVTRLRISISHRDPELSIIFYHNGPPLAIPDDNTGNHFNAIDNRISYYQGTLQYKQEGIFEAAVIRLDVSRVPWPAVADGS